MTDPDRIPRTRRRFVQEMLAGVVALVAVACSPARKVVKTVVPPGTSGTIGTAPTTTSAATGSDFGDRIDIASVDHIRSTIARTHAPYYAPEARSYVSPFPKELADRARSAYPNASLPLLSEGLVVLYQRCPHLGCRVPWCATSEWFECPCHGAKFDRVGEARRQPTPRGMDHLQASIVRGRLVIDTAKVLPGLPYGTNTTHQRPAGPFCV